MEVCDVNINMKRWEKVPLIKWLKEERSWTSVSCFPTHLTRLWEGRNFPDWPPALRCSSCWSWCPRCWPPSLSGGWWRGRAPSSGPSLCFTPTWSSGQGYSFTSVCSNVCVFSPPGPQHLSCLALTPAEARGWPGISNDNLHKRERLNKRVILRYWDNFILSTPLTAALNLVAALHNDQFYPVAKLSVKEAKEWFPYIGCTRYIYFMCWI